MESLDRFLSLPLTKGGVSTACLVAILFLSLIFFYPEKDSIKNIPYFEEGKPYAIYYVIVTLAFAALSVWRKSFITPEIRHSKCNYCGAEMETTKLMCTKCRSDANKAREKQD